MTDVQLQRLADSDHHSRAVAPAEPTARRDAAWPLAWTGLALGALLALAQWQRSPGWLMLLLSAVLTIGAFALRSTLPRSRTIPLLALVALAVAIGIGVNDTMGLRRMLNNWATWSERDRRVRAEKIKAGILDLAEDLTLSVNRTLKSIADGSTSADGATPLIVPSTRGAESALAVFQRGRLMSRIGQSRVPIDTGPEGVTIVQTSFHTALRARKTSDDGKTQVVATALLASAPPADRFSRSLLQKRVGASGASRVTIGPPPPPGARPDTSTLLVVRGVTALAQVSAEPLLEGEARVMALQRARIQTGIPLFVAGLLLLTASWRRPARTVHRLAATAFMLMVIASVPLGEMSNVSSVFDASNYFAKMGGPLTANVAALLLTAALCLSTLFLVLRARRRLPARRTGAAIAVLIAALGPFVLRDLARGIELPPAGASMKLWVAWQLGIALAGASVLLAGVTAGQVALGSRRGVTPWLAPSIAALSALAAPALWRAPGTWPEWFPLVWIVAIGALAFTRRSAGLVARAAIVAGSGAVMLTWGATMRTRVHLAEIEVGRLTSVDDNAQHLLESFARDVALDTAATAHIDALLSRYAASDLAGAGYTARLAQWVSSNPNIPDAVIALASFADSINTQARLADVARESGQVELTSVPDGPTKVLLAAVPAVNGRVTTIAVPPRTRLMPLDPFVNFFGLASGTARARPYTVEIVPLDSLTGRALPETGHLLWRRRETAMHGDARIGTGSAARQVHVEIGLRTADALVPRGALLVMLDVGTVLLLWAASALADGGLLRWLRLRRSWLARSYRVRLSLALVAFFVAPAAAFAGWTAIRLPEDDRLARELKLREALRMAELPRNRDALAMAADYASAPLFAYRNAQLTMASDSVLEMVAPIGRLLPAGLDFGATDQGDDDDFEAVRVTIGNQDALVGYRSVRAPRDSDVVPSPTNATGNAPGSAVVATPARGDEFVLDQRRADLVMLVLFAMSFGALAALWLSGVASRSLARPVGTLREAALALASGQRNLQLDEAPAAEFSPVFRAFGQMADDLSASRAALESAQRRTEAVLQNVASGVLAVRPDGSVLLANPRAEAMLGVRLRENSNGSQGMTAPELSPVELQLRTFLAGSDYEEAFDITIHGRQLNARLTRLPGGAVLTLDDVTELASAQRVLAWGEMARQVAHEIKNPLTPIRLGVQHLRRAFRDGRGDFNEILETNVARVLAEIDRLDEIARAFSRYGMAPTEQPTAVAVDVGAVVRDVLALESLGEGDVAWLLESEFGDTPVLAWARSDELSEVLLNVLENARLAKARRVEVALSADETHVHIRVRDDGSGIAAAVLPRVFEPHFSTRTSGSGLGLAISRRLIEGWGGTVGVDSEVGHGTTVHVTLRSAAVRA